jgi:Dyp-type peroxidase family
MIPERWRKYGVRVDRRDLQGNVLCGYGNAFAHARYLFVGVVDAAAGRQWLWELADHATNAVSWGRHKPSETLNVALTARGLRAIGVPEEILGKFPKEFRDGMVQRATLIGDTGASDWRAWEDGLREPQVLVTVMAQDAEVRDRRAAALRERIESTDRRLRIEYEQDAQLIQTGDKPGAFAREHFGFADGFSQPAIRGKQGPDTRKGMGTPGRWGWWHRLAPGEFVLGYPGEDGLPPKTAPAPLAQSASYMVWRKLKQDVDRFNDYIAEAAERDLSGDLALPADRSFSGCELEERRQLLAAKIVGRWKDGASLAVSPRPPAGGSKRQLDRRYINRFRYGEDPEGVRCPVGAHVRRANPRDALGWQGRLTKRHRIIRRGMPYEDGSGPGRERGLIFVCYQADIARQFELIQSRWLNDGDPFWLGSERDPLTMGGEQGGDGDSDSGGHMTIQGAPPGFLAPLSSFITTRGGDYFFVPGVAGLRALASAYWR